MRSVTNLSSRKCISKMQYELSGIQSYFVSATRKQEKFLSSYVGRSRWSESTIPENDLDSRPFGLKNLNMLDEGNEVSKGAEDVFVDVLEISQNREMKVVAKEDPDATENSSSFADTTSGNENTSGLSDTEVESQFFDDSDLAPPFDGFGSMFPIRKKKLTSHWRNFIHPLMWRCKWTELRIKELESQSSKYDKGLARLDHKKHKALDQITLEESGSKSFPFVYPSYRKKPMKRRRRKRVEETTDIASYMSNHILFSERENRRADLDGVPAGEDPNNSDHHSTGHDEFGVQNDSVYSEEDDNNYLEHVLRKIELVHTRVHKLKSQLNTVIMNNTAIFSSSENLSQLELPCDLQTSSVRSPTFSACNGDTVSVGYLYGSSQPLSDYDLGDLFIPDESVSSFGEAITIPDIIESTVGLLSSIDVTPNPVQVGDSSEMILDNILIHEEVAEVEESTLKNIYIKTEEAENSGGEEESNNAMQFALEAELVEKTQEQSALESCLASEIHFPKNKRKRGERKAGSANWSVNGLLNVKTNENE